MADEVSLADASARYGDEHRIGGIKARPPNLSRAGLAAILHREIGLSNAHALAAIELVSDLMREALAESEDVKIVGFGTFKLQRRSEYVGYNPKTGAATAIPSRRVITFHPSQNLRDRVAGK